MVLVSAATKPNRKQSLLFVLPCSFCLLFLIALARNSDSFFPVTSMQIISKNGNGSVAPPSLLHQVASVFFPIDAHSGKIQFPGSVETVVIDIGARDSDYLSVLERTQDETVALILIDPYPDSIVPLQQRAENYTMREMNGMFLNKRFQNRVFTIQAAMAESEYTVDFKVSHGPSCGSILETHENNSFWCSDTKERMHVRTFTLQSLLDLIPIYSGNHTISVNVKIDAEGADLIVLKGAGASMSRVSTAVIECIDLPPGSTKGLQRKGDCLKTEAVQYMCQTHRFCESQVETQGGVINMMFSHPEISKHHHVIPPFLKQDGIRFQRFYKKLAVA